MSQQVFGFDCVTNPVIRRGANEEAALLQRVTHHTCFYENAEEML